MSTEKVASYFEKIKKVCDDNTQLWNANIYHDFIFVDQTNNTIYSKYQDDYKVLVFRKNIYTLSPNKNLSKPLRFNGELVPVVSVTNIENEDQIIKRAIECLFLYHTENIINYNYTLIESKIDNDDVIFWYKHELIAIRHAIETDDEQERIQYIKDAATFRRVRMQQPSFRRDTNSTNGSNNRSIYNLNLYGCALLTSIILTSEDNNQIKEELIKRLDALYESIDLATYVKTYTALYAALAYYAGIDFSSINLQKTDFGNLVYRTYDINNRQVTIQMAEEISQNYLSENIKEQEEKRKQTAQREKEKIFSAYNDRPVIQIDLIRPAFYYTEPEIISIPQLGFLYKNLKIKDNWGSLTVKDNGCLISEDRKILKLAANVIEINKNTIYGDGWELVLAGNWKLQRDGIIYTLSQQAK